MNTKEKYDLADMVVAHALKSGADQVAVTISDNRSTEIEIRDQKIDTLKESNRSNLSVDIYTENKYSSHSTNRMKKEELLKFVEEAIAATKYLAPDEFRTLPEPELYYSGGGPELNTMDPKIDSLDARTKIDMANQSLNEAYGEDERIISVSSYYSDSISNMVKVASNGFRGDSGSTGISLAVTVSIKSDTGRPSDYWYENSRFIDRLKKTDIGREALVRALNKMNPKKIASGKYPVVIENRVAMNIAGPIYNSLSGANIHQKQSFLIGKEGKPVTSSILTVYDDPFIPSGSGSRLFDGEGLASVRRSVIEKGILKNYYIDTYYGKKLGMKPTSGSSSNVVFGKGKRSPQEMISSISKGVYITGFIGGNCNLSTGDFSYGIEGFYIENGRIVHPVNEMNITGNMNTLWFSLSELGNDPRENDSIMIPSLMFKDVVLSGI